MTRPTEKACIAQRHLVRALGARPVAIAVASLLSTSGVFAQTLHHFSIPPGPLSTVLGHAAATAGVLLSVDARLTQGMDSPGVQGHFTAEDGLVRALAGSGLMPVRRPDGGFTLRAIAVATTSPGGSGDASVAPDSPKEHSLSTVTVSGKAPGSTTEGTGSYTTFSTSSSARLNLTPQETPQSVTVITRQRMDDQRLNSLNDVLEASAGIVIKPFSVGADGPQMWARGAAITNFQIDGIPSSASMSNYLQSTVLYDRVEIVKGATGLMSGLGTPAATINMIRKRPAKQAQASVSVEAGNWSRHGAGMDISRPLNEDASIRGRLVADYQRDGAWTSNYRQDYGVLYGIGEVDLGPGTLLTAGFSHITRNTDSPIRPVPIIYSNGQSTRASLQQGAGADWAYYDHRVDSVFSSIEHRFNSGWSAKAELNHSRYEYDSQQAALSGPVDQATGRGAYSLMPRWANAARQTSLDAYVTGPFTLLGRQHELIGGITLSQLDQDSPSYPTPRQNIRDISNWRNELTQPIRIQTGSSSSKEYQYGAYASSRLQLGDATNLLLGGRLTSWKRDSESLGYASGSLTRQSARERNKLIPYIGVVHALNDNYSLYASYTKIFRPQDSGTLMYTRTGVMPPEEGTGFEAGVKASFANGELTSSLSLFRSEQENLAVWNGVTGFYEAAHKARSEGIEFELNGKIAAGWQLTGGYTHSRISNQEGHPILTRIPRSTAKLFTSYRLPGDWNRLTLGGGVNWESKTGDPYATYTQRGYALVNLMVRYEVSKQLALTAHLNNALDKRYYMALAGDMGLYGPPRNFMVSAKYRF